MLLFICLCLFVLDDGNEKIVIIGDGTEIRKYDAVKKRFNDLVQLHTGHIDGLDFYPAEYGEDGKSMEFWSSVTVPSEIKIML